MEAALPLLADDVVVVVPPALSAERTSTRADGARRYFTGFDGAIDEVRFDLREIQDTCRTPALAVMAVERVGAVTRIPIDLTRWSSARHAGRIVHWRRTGPRIRRPRNDRDAGPPQLS